MLRVTKKLMLTRAVITEACCGWRECKKKEVDEDDAFKSCTECKIERYCSRRCQKKDWNEGDHKRLCKIMAATPRCAWSECKTEETTEVPLR